MSLAPLYDHLWQSTLFAAVAGLLTLAFRKNRARVRHSLWLAASVKFVIPLSMLIALGNQIQWHRVPASDLTVAVVAMSEPFTMPLASAPTPAIPVKPAVNRLPAILLGVWACGFVGIACSWWVRWRRIAAVVRAGSPLPLQLPISAVVSPTLVEPGVFGVIRPRLLLPASIFERLTPEQLNAVIAHELYHVHHRDNLVAAFHMFVETVFWFHPLVWWIGKRMVEERERACDESVLSLGGEPRVYAEAVLNVCKLYVESPLACVAGITGANLKRRIEVIMTKRIAHDLNFGKKLGLAIAAMAALVAPILIGTMHSTAARAQSPAPAPTRLAVVADASPTPAPVTIVADASPTPAPVTIVADASPAPAVADEKPRPRPTPAVAMAPQVVAQSAAAPEPQISPTATTSEALKIRGDYANENFQNRAMASAYKWYGPPNRKERTATAEIWQYDYLDLYQDKVTIEFPAGSKSAARITWPPRNVFEGVSRSDAKSVTLATALARETHSETAAATPAAGLPGRHAFVEPSLRINRVEQFMNLVVPMDSFSGRVDFIGQVTDSFGMTVANVRDSADSTAGSWQSAFVLLPGPYSCTLLVREQATGLMYTETIPFQVSK